MPRSRRKLPGIGRPDEVIVVTRRGDRQNFADRLGPVEIVMIVEGGDHVFDRRSSSAWEKFADTLRRISLACRSSRFSRSRASSFSATSVGTPARLPLSISVFLTHSFRVCPSSRSSLQQIRSPPSATDAHVRDRGPAEPRGSGPPVKTCSSSCLS